MPRVIILSSVESWHNYESIYMALGVRVRVLSLKKAEKVSRLTWESLTLLKKNSSLVIITEPHSRPGLFLLITAVKNM